MRIEGSMINGLQLPNAWRSLGAMRYKLCSTDALKAPLKNDLPTRQIRGFKRVQSDLALLQGAGCTSTAVRSYFKHLALILKPGDQNKVSSPSRMLPIAPDRPSKPINCDF